MIKIRCAKVQSTRICVGMARLFGGKHHNVKKEGTSVGLVNPVIG